jgi:hypothetical protein
MDQIRPIGPVERDIEPVFAAQRIGRDGGGRKRDEREEQPRREPRAPEPVAEPPREPGDGDGGSLVDVRV